MIIKSAVLLCGGDVNHSNLPITGSRSNAMIPVNGKPVIGWIVEDLLEKNIDEIIIVLRYDNHKLLNYLEWAFGNRAKLHFSFVQSGGTILHSLLSGLAWVVPNNGVHIVLGDTLVKDKLSEYPDYIFCGSYKNSEDWCLVECDENGNAIEYYDKLKEISKSNLGALAGVYSLSDVNLLRGILMDSIRVGESELSQVLKNYSQKRIIKVIQTENWFDFGHIEYFNLAKQKLLQSRYFNSLKIDSLYGTITKTSLKSKKLSEELAWYTEIPESLTIFTPRLIVSENNQYVTIKQEYYGYPNLAELYVFGEISYSVWMNAIQKLMDVHDLFRKEEVHVLPEDVIEMYGEKTIERLQELEEDEVWSEILSHDHLFINGVEYKNVRLLKNAIESHVHLLSQTVKGSVIHGDYCFSNILFDLNTQLVRVVDPRGSFGSQNVGGDPRYDMAKLRHSIVGKYDFILADLFKVSRSENEFSFEVFEPDFYASLSKYFDELLLSKGFNPRDIMFIEGLLFISMVPLHKDSPKRQLAMFLTGIKILNNYK